MTRRDIDQRHSVDNPEKVREEKEEKEEEEEEKEEEEEEKKEEEEEEEEELGLVEMQIFLSSGVDPMGFTEY
ncbi:hypothetical protein HZH66_006048 [Vespula vulgaris]|uniref:Uncharacterized protein n=1 Tax=Vespula vulgaris TaxID=7454 RepID=A0A834NAD2_VESVU|nr:hypothetical protein HZH66_006048 [Vespula vulgaris]